MDKMDDEEKLAVDADNLIMGAYSDQLRSAMCAEFSMVAVFRINDDRLETLQNFSRFNPEHSPDEHLVCMLQSLLATVQTLCEAAPDAKFKSISLNFEGEEPVHFNFRDIENFESHNYVRNKND